MEQQPPFDHQSFLTNLTARPGVYRMLGEEGQVLYVGKAKNLQRRVRSYFNRSNNLRIQTSATRRLRIHSFVAVKVPKPQVAESMRI